MTISRRLAFAFALGTLSAASCSSDDPAPSGSNGGSSGSGGTTDGGGGTAGSSGSSGTGATDGGIPKPGPGEICEAPDPATMRLRYEPSSLVVAVGETRTVDLVVDPSFCDPTAVSFASSDVAVAAAPAPGRLDLVTPRVRVTVTGVAVGTTTITASVPLTDAPTGDLPVTVVASSAVAACAGSGAGHVADGGTVRGTGGLAGASIGLQAGATKPNAGSFLWRADEFDATLACAPDQVPAGFTAIGPAVTFGPSDLRLTREIPLSVPVNPAALPDGARMRHVTVSYKGPAVATARTIPIADPRIVATAGGGFELSFKAPRLGTYQALVKTNAGTVTRTRHLTHRAVIGVSMGGGGAAMVGLRNHDRFDVLAPLGGPVDWTWLMGHIERNHIAGFSPNDGSNVPASLPPLRTPTLPYEHPSSFNRWWYEYPRDGNGGRFPRDEYVQIFRDLALMFGNPNGYNSAAGAESLPAGVSPTDPSVVGDHSGRTCAVWVDPIDGDPNYTAQREAADNCPTERCAHPLTLNNYYDDEFNPNGTWPVITVCDGSPQDELLSPYANTWKPNGNGVPLELALAVDYNGNGTRDENEPIIRAGHEPYDDYGVDGLPSAQEPGYQAGVNDDPAGDDWDPQYNPSGKENNLRFDAGEPYRDYGLDGVAGTASSPYDFGEGDNQFTMSPGLQKFLERDTRTVIEQSPMGTQAHALDDDALSRVDIWSDGGTRDLFNFAVDAQALMGAWSSRGRVVHYYTQFDAVPGVVNTSSFAGGTIDWGGVPGGVLLRYGKVDPTSTDINSGSGQHVGTPLEITRRLMSSLYYIGTRWPDADHALNQSSVDDPDPSLPTCQVQGACDFEFTDSRGRKGPVSINFPPGYANKNSQYKRYPVIYMLHGYGQTPEDLKVAIAFLSNWMNSSLDSPASRLPKAIIVYVDGRCRSGDGAEAECIRGTFYADSVRQDGPKMESWFMELMGKIDTDYRTLPAADVPWTE